MSQVKSVGIIGVGAMGGALARRLLRHGITVHVRDIREQAMRDLLPLGAQPTHSPHALAAQSEMVVVLVVDAQQIDDVLFGKEGAASALAPHGVTLLSSTISPKDAQEFAARLSAAHRLSLDAPISGGPARAEAGTLSMMLAGSDEAQERASAILSLMADKIFRVGPRSGDAARFKLLNNALASINLVAGAEILALGESMGLNPRLVLEVICASSGASWVVEDRMRRALDADFAARAATKILAKDISLFMEMARAARFPSLLGSQAAQVFQSAMAHHLAEEDDAALFKLYQRFRPSSE